MIRTAENPRNQLAHFNFDRMYKYLGDDKETIKEILLMVLEELKIAIKKFEDYIFTERLEEIKFTAHQLIGTTASVGLERLCTTVRKIEEQKNFDSGVLRQLLTSLKFEAKTVKSLINSYIVNT